MANRLFGGHELTVARFPGHPDGSKIHDSISQAARASLNSISSRALSKGFSGPKFDGFAQLLQDANQASIANAAKMLEDEGMSDLAQELRSVNLV